MENRPENNGGDVVAGKSDGARESDQEEESSKAPFDSQCLFQDARSYSNKDRFQIY